MKNHWTQNCVFKEWTTAFPGKMGLSWKRGWDGVGTKEEAEAMATEYCNTIAIPVQLFEHIKEMERRMVEAETALAQIRCLATLSK